MPRRETTIWRRLLEPRMADIGPETARWILSLAFDASDSDRVNLLSAKARLGTLTKAEGAELDEYLRSGDLLALLQSKARITLKAAGIRS